MQNHSHHQKLKAIAVPATTHHHLTAVFSEVAIGTINALSRLATKLKDAFHSVHLLFSPPVKLISSEEEAERLLKAQEIKKLEAKKLKKSQDQENGEQSELTSALTRAASPDEDTDTDIELIEDGSDLLSLETGGPAPEPST